MAVLLPFLLVAGVTALLCWGLVRAAAHLRRRRVGSAAMSGAMSVIDEIWHPAAFDPQIEIQQAYERQAPTPSPDDKDSKDSKDSRDDRDGKRA